MLKFLLRFRVCRRATDEHRDPTCRSTLNHSTPHHGLWPVGIGRVVHTSFVLCCRAACATFFCFRIEKPGWTKSVGNRAMHAPGMGTAPCAMRASPSPAFDPSMWRKVHDYWATLPRGCSTKSRHAPRQIHTVALRATTLQHAGCASSVSAALHDPSLPPQHRHLSLARAALGCRAALAPANHAMTS